MILNLIHCFKKNNLSILGILVLLFGCTHQSDSTSITISNTQARTTNDGQIVDAHDGRVIQFRDRYYWYGTAYGNTNGFVKTNHYRCYSSDDLVTWQYEGKLIPDQPAGVYYRPHVIYNVATEQYVLWYNWYPELWDGQFGVAVSQNPTGPFEIINDDVEMANSQYGLGDFGLFVDEDGKGYISYNTIKDHMVSIEELSADYLSSTLNNGGVIAKNVEAGSSFKKDGKYYLLTDYTCCFCNYGSGARVYQSDNPLSAYQYTGNINRYPGQEIPALHDQVNRGTRYVSLQKTPDGFQSMDITLNEANPIQTIDLFLFTGNRRENCGDVSNPRVHPKIVTPKLSIKKWEKGAWIPMDTELIKIQKSALSEQLTLRIEETMTRFKIQVDTASTPFSAIYVNEVIVNGQKGPLEITEAYLSGPNIAQNPIIPAQQTYVMELSTAQGTEFIWMGDLWGSASDNQKGHDYQYWSAPLEFNEDGTIQRLQWENEWSFIKK